MLFFVFITFNTVNAQILKKIKDRVAQIAEDKVINKAGDATDRSMDKVEDDIKGKDKSKSDKKCEQNNTEGETDEKEANAGKTKSG